MSIFSGCNIEYVYPYHNPNEGRNIINENFQCLVDSINFTITGSTSGHSIVNGGTNITVLSSGATVPPVYTVYLDSAVTISSLYATTVSGGTIYSGSTDLSSIFTSLIPSGITGNPHETLRFNTAGNSESSALLLNDMSGITATTYLTVGTRTGGTIGNNSFTYGLANVASGLQSKAGGVATVASGDYSVANGFQTYATDLLTRAEGFLTSASTDYAWAIGYGTSASGWSSTAFGYLTETRGQLALAIGWSSKAYGEESFAGGFNSRAEGPLSFAFGNETTATTNNAFAIGEETYAGSINSLAGGYSAYTFGSNSLSYGWRTRTEGYGSQAFGLTTITKGQGAFAQGGGTIAGRTTSGIPGTGRYAVATGYYTFARGDSSFAGGNGIFGGPYVYAAGSASFNHSTITATGYTSSGAAADNSAILGGLNQVIDASASRSIILGGYGITATTADTVYVPALNIYSALTINNSLDEVLVRDSDGSIRYRNASSIGTQGDFLPISGGTVTGDTIFTQGLSADTLAITTTTVAPLNLPVLPLSFTSATHGDVWVAADLSTGTTYLNLVVSGVTKTIELT